MRPSTSLSASHNIHILPLLPPNMSQHARIEELSDSGSDPPEHDPDDFTDTLIRPADIPRPSSLRPPQQQPPPQSRQPQPPAFNSTPPPEYKHYQCLYPLYFDANKTRSEGRRVSAEQAIKNPLAREIVDAVQLLGLKTVFEPGKTHPRDWANPGRVRVLVKEGGRARNARVKNSGCISLSSLLLKMICKSFIENATLAYKLLLQNITSTL